MTENSMSGPRWYLWAILVGALLPKLFWIGYLDDRAYPDIQRALAFGYGVHSGTLSIHEHFDNSKTFVGPVAWYQLYRMTGLWGLKTFNTLVFLLLFFVLWRIGRREFTPKVTLVALLLFAFYVGTHRNVVAGEMDDNVASLLLAFGVLLRTRGERGLLSAAVMGVGFLFKFWMVILFAGYLTFHLLRRDWSRSFWACFGFFAPFALITAVDGGASVESLLSSVERQVAYSGWGLIGFRFASTGLGAAALASVIVYWRSRSDRDLFFMLTPLLYPVYVLAHRDAHAMSFVMMACMVLYSFLIAELLLGAPTIRATRRLLPALLVLYILATTVITHFNLYRDTKPINPRRSDSLERWLDDGCRVDPGSYPPGPPTDPDVRNSRIRLFRHMGSLRSGRPSRTRWSSQLSYPMQSR